MSRTECLHILHQRRAPEQAVGHVGRAVTLQPAARTCPRWTRSSRTPLRRCIGDQHLHHHATRRLCPLSRRGHQQTRRRPALTRVGEHRLDLHHARAAVAAVPVTGLVCATEMGDVSAETMRDLPNYLAGGRIDGATVEGKLETAHCHTHASRAAVATEIRPHFLSHRHPTVSSA